MRQLAGGAILGIGLSVASSAPGNGIELRTDPIELTGTRSPQRRVAAPRPWPVTTPTLRMTGAGR
jgi:hypothetical protein